MILSSLTYSGIAWYFVPLDGGISQLIGLVTDSRRYKANLQGLKQRSSLSRKGLSVSLSYGSRNVYQRRLVRVSNNVIRTDQEKQYLVLDKFEVQNMALRLNARSILAVS